MHEYPRDSLGSSPWQATSMSLVWNIRGALQLYMVDPETFHEQEPKKLTTGAVYMIFLLLAFVILTVIGSSIDAYEYFLKRLMKTVMSKELQKETTTDKGLCSKNEENTSQNSVWMKNCKLVLSCFSLQDNCQRLFNTSANEEHLSCLDGIRTLGYITVVLGHLFGLYANVLRNADVIYETSFFVQVIPKGFLIVEVFFLISGILNGYSTSRQYHENKGEVSWMSLPRRRFFRITPIQLIVLGFNTTLFPYVGSGPLWPKYETNPVCEKYWIWNLLYMNNFLSFKHQCMSTFWYLGCLLQLHLISPLFLIPILRKPKMGYAFTVLAVITSCLIGYKLIIHHLLEALIKITGTDKPDILEVFDLVGLYLDFVHINSYIRLCSYPIGVAFGYYIHNRRMNNIKKSSQVILFSGWIICIIFLYLSLENSADLQASPYTIATFHCLRPFFLTCGLTWVIFACVTGQCGFLNKFLSCKFFKVYSRLTFFGYLLHMLVLEKYFLSIEELIDYSFLDLVSTSIYLLLWTTAISFIFALVIGQPVLRINDLIDGLYEKKAHQKIKEKNI